MAPPFMLLQMTTSVTPMFPCSTQAIALPPKTQILKWMDERVRRICPDDLGPDHVVVWENQRRWPGTGYSAEFLFASDPDPFTRTGSSSGNTSIEDVAPQPRHMWASGSDWLISMSCACDEDGWQCVASPPLPSPSSVNICDTCIVM